MTHFETSEDAFKKANKYFVEEEYDKALQHYTDAIELNTDDNLFAEFFEKRSICNHQLENFSDAIEDADKALKYNPKSTTAFLRKGMAYFALEEYESAKACLEEGLSIDKSHAKLTLWLNKANAELNAEKQKQEEVRAPVAQTIPQQPEPQVQLQDNTKAPVTPQLVPQQPPSIKSRIRVQHYQNASEVVVDILGLKDVPVANRSVKLEDNRAIVTLKLPDEDYIKEIALHSEINAAQSTVNHTTMKIELTLKKKVKNVEWPSLEQSNASAKPIGVSQPEKKVDPRKYPSSKGSVNWDALESDIKKEKEEEGDPLTKLFQQIYHGADEDTRRAMIKSFSESGGTVLSTNWKEVGKEKVKVQAPEGMEPRKWNE